MKKDSLLLNEVIDQIQVEINRNTDCIHRIEADNKLPNQTLRDIARGKRDPRISTVEKVLAVFGWKLVLVRIEP